MVREDRLSTERQTFMDDTPSKKKDPVGLKKLRAPGGAAVRAKHPEWGRPNKKFADKIKRRQARYDSMSDKTSKGGHVMHRPGSHRKP